MPSHSSIGFHHKESKMQQFPLIPITPSSPTIQHVTYNHTKLAISPPNISVKQISSGNSHSLLLTTDGRVFVVGNCNFGIHGQGKFATLHNLTFPNMSVVPFPSNIKIIQISANYWHALALAGNYSKSRVYWDRLWESVWLGFRL